MGMVTAIGCGDDDGGVDPVPDAGPLPTGDGGIPLPEDGGTVEMDAAVEPHTGDLTLGRLLVSDHESATTWIFDLDDESPALLDTWTTAAPSRVYADRHGRYGYLVQTTANRVDVVDSGIVFESHVDHYHIHEEAPEQLELVFEGTGPTHFTVHDGWATAFYDGSGSVDTLQERSISAGSPMIRNIVPGPAHHGVAVVAFGHMLATVGTEGEALPSEVGVWPVTDLAGEPELMAGPCPGLHGEAAAGDFVLFGCSDGVLVVELHGDHFHTGSIANPEGTPEGTRVGSLVAHEDLPVFIGNWGSEGLAIIDPEAGSITPVATPAPVVSFALDMEGEHLYALTADGNLHRLEAMDGAPAGEPLAVTGEIDLTGGHGAARPALAAGAGRMYLALPGEGEVLEIHGADWEVERTIVTGGVPYSLAVVSASPDWTDEEHEH
ncbi:MAG: hypothetical protein CMN30_28610 [Sandaracinus sp.]|nr:hypothetical protein [Sandaracinus sp.]